MSNSKNTTKYENLSEAAQELLSWVKEEQQEGFYDERGAYVEHDRCQCKPWNSKVVKEVAKSGMVKLHADSDDFQGGVAFMKVKKKYLNEVEG